jgi:hypothetical protein
VDESLGQGFGAAWQTDGRRYRVAQHGCKYRWLHGTATRRNLQFEVAGIR